MNSGSFKNRKYYCASSQLEVGNCLARHQSNELKSYINHHFCENTRRGNVYDGSMQVISRAALFCTPLFQRDIVAADADIKLQTVAAGVGDSEPSSSDLKDGNSGLTSFNAADNNRFNSNGRCDFVVLRTRKDFLG